MMDMLLDRGRDAAGLWGDHVIPSNSAPPPSPTQPVNDNWGYLTAGYLGYALSLPEDSPRRQRYLAEARRTFEAAIEYRSVAWERGQMDGYADSIEGALYLLPFLKIDGAARWIDDETGILLAYQKPDGFGGKTYLDGNLVRTALLYALFRTQGSRVDPWRPGVRLGAVSSADGLHLALSSDAPWTGRIIFDRIRHREYLNLPYEYPRLNGWPEWFAVDPVASYQITLNREGKEPETKVVEGREMIDGLVVGELKDELPLHLQVRPKT